MAKSSAKEASFRICIAVLLAVQAACWILMLLDLYQPGKPLLLFRNSTSILTRISERSSKSALLYYKDIRTRH
ncbi:hypothetical protein P154DRAFT_480589 [Amniculicola lignicola CBS 123094]|uniref:Uncharacterized protein n=1 Tax=Amniculicola lignicola CBS 123094 TaxID=1392246 RepID=A0A6A5X0Q3_9PLEO|nr:hypothetical protein P154DRAFT_480589 [Amniculicola lignicola CBS 123094]